MNEQPINPGNTEFILPIICPHCQRELNLSMLFGLLAPEVIEPSEPQNINEFLTSKIETNEPEEKKQEETS